ncbi:MAG TPA: DUF6623 family protein [Blastocatellia bacterium]|jgi:hypothetical protein
MARNDLWTHGVATQIEYPSLVVDGGAGKPRGFPRRRGSGLVVRQEAGTDNWFHLAIPSLTVYRDDTSIHVEYVAIKVKLNENAAITAVHLWDGDDRFEAWSFNETSEIRGPVVERGFETRHEINKGLVVSIKVNFKTYRAGGPMGEAEFIGAGAKFVQY